MGLGARRLAASAVFAGVISHGVASTDPHKGMAGIPNIRPQGKGSNFICTPYITSRIWKDRGLSHDPIAARNDQISGDGFNLYLVAYDSLLVDTILVLHPAASEGHGTATNRTTTIACDSAAQYDDFASACAIDPRASCHLACAWSVGDCQIG